MSLQKCSRGLIMTILQFVVMKWYDNIPVHVEFTIIHQFIGKEVGSSKTNIPIIIHSQSTSIAPVTARAILYHIA